MKKLPLQSSCSIFPPHLYLLPETSEIEELINNYDTKKVSKLGAR